MNQNKRRRLLIQELSKVTGRFGFTHHSGAYFSRKRNDVVDAFFFQFTRSNFRFYLTYVTDAPTLLPQHLRDNATLGLDSNTPSFAISQRLDECTDFGCKYEEHIHNSCVKIADGFETQTIPWFERFQTPNDIIVEYHHREIRSETPTKSDSARMVLRWTVYGLMLHNIGRSSDARTWLECARVQWASSEKQTEQETEWIRIIDSTGIGT